MGGEAQKTRFHFRDDRPDPHEPHRPEPPGGVGVRDLVLHMVLMIPLVPATILDALVTITAAVHVVRALGSPSHSLVVARGAAPTSALLLAVFLAVMVVVLGLLAWVLALLATVVLDRRRWLVVLAAALGMLAVGAAVWALTGAGLPATASVFGVFVYIALVAVGHLAWARRHANG